MQERTEFTIQASISKYWPPLSSTFGCNREKRLWRSQIGGGAIARWSVERNSDIPTRARSHKVVVDSVSIHLVNAWPSLKSPISYRRSIASILRSPIALTTSALGGCAGTANWLRLHFVNGWSVAKVPMDIGGSPGVNGFERLVNGMGSSCDRGIPPIDFPPNPPLVKTEVELSAKLETCCAATEIL